MTDQEIIEEVAEDLYTLYCQKVGGKNFQGDPLPGWQEFGSDPKKTLQANAWRAVAARAIDTLLSVNFNPARSLPLLKMECRPRK